MNAHVLWTSRITFRSTDRLSDDIRTDRRTASPTVAADRFLTLADVAEVLNISGSQAYALVRNNELEAIKVGGRGQWRVERAKLEEYIARMYDETRRFVECHPFIDADSDHRPSGYPLG